MNQNIPLVQTQIQPQRAIRLPLHLRYSRIWMAMALIFVDLFSLTLAGTLAAATRNIVAIHDRTISSYLDWTWLLVIFLVVYAWRGLYPGVGISPVEELRRITVSTSLVFLIISALTSWTHTAEGYSRFVLGFTWFLALFIMPLARWIIRYILVWADLWGDPVALIGFGEQGKEIYNFLENHKRLGLRPAVIIDGVQGDEPTETPLPLLRLREFEWLSSPYLNGIRTAVMVISEIPADIQAAIVERKNLGFSRLVMIPNLQWIGSTGVTSYDLEGILGLEVRGNLLNSPEQAVKRVMDLFIILLGGLIALPVLLIIALLIRLDSPGPVIYGHTRIGKDGRKFKAWKFRTMVNNADQILEKFLQENPHLRAEWEATQKLKNDPRITRVGRFLRVLSLDELPQVLNVLRGEMSVVGPRPIVQDEVMHYKDIYKLYCTVLPGITGMWQVSGRSKTTYEFRVRLDEYYVRNWSIWLDIYIMIRTVWVVIRRDGAY